MADDPTEHALAIVRALDAAGALQPRAGLSAGSERDVAAISRGVVSALSAAGRLNTEGTVSPQMSRPEIAQLREPQVGDVYWVDVDFIWKKIRTDVDPPLVEIQLEQAVSRGPVGVGFDASKISWILEFPPNNEVYLPEFAGLWTHDFHLDHVIEAELEITGRREANAPWPYFVGRLRQLRQSNNLAYKWDLSRL